MSDSVEVDPKLIIEILKALEGLKRKLQQLIK